jgi:hypothetical protein
MDIIMDISNNMNRFSDDQSIAHYTPICYKLTEEEVIQNGGVTCISGYCMCLDKTTCECLENMKKNWNLK